MVREKKLASVLAEGYKLSFKEIPYVTIDDLTKSGFDKALIATYKGLGGRHEFPDIPFTQEQIIIEPNIILILDDERKFNRYRAQTLKSGLYQDLLHFPLEKYKSFCRTYENQCLKSASHASAWTSREAEKSFGKAADFGDLDSIGAPLWKEIAMHDYILDHIPLLFDFKLLRIAIWDNILINSKMYKISDLLLTSRQDLNKSLYKFMDRKIITLLPSPPTENSNDDLNPSR